MNHHAAAIGADARDYRGHSTPRDDNGPMADRDQVIIAYLPLVQKIAKGVHARLPEQVELSDLVSAGTLGLVDAYNKYESAKRVPFGAYATIRIRGAIIDSLRLLDWSPRSLRRKAREIQEAISGLTRQLGRAPSEAEIASVMRISLEEYQQLLGGLHGLAIGSLHAEPSAGGEEELAYVPDPTEKGPLFRCMESEMRQRIARAIDALPDRERLAVTLYYYEEMTQPEIGIVLGVGASRISQLLTSATLRLRSSLADESRFDS